MMNAKIHKLREEHEKNKAKISELQARNRDIEKQIRELENTDIVGMVRAQGLTLEQFAELLQTLKAPVSTENTPDKEASAYEEA